jgi:hypothetical protein
MEEVDRHVSSRLHDRFLCLSRQLEPFKGEYD